MVQATDSLPSPNSMGQVGIIIGNPMVSRGNRVNIMEAGGYLVYGVKQNVHFRHVAEPFTKSLVYTRNLADICVISKRPVYPNQWAVGDVGGKVTILEINEEGTQVEKVTEMGMLGGRINSLAWIDDGEKLTAVGEGSTGTRANCLTVKTGTKAGEIFGHTGTALTSFMTPKPYTLISTGESPEILKHADFPFKGASEKVAHPHDASKFIPKISLSPDARFFASVGLDKQIVIYDVATWEKKSIVTKGHTMGIYDCDWYDNEHITTCSADNKIKVWVVKDGEIEQEPAHVLLQTPTEEKKAQVHRQVVATWRGEDGSVGGINLNGDVLRWAPFQGDTAVQRAAGNMSFIKSMCMFKGDILHASKDRVFLTKGGQATQGHDIVADLVIDLLFANSQQVYVTCSGQKMILQSLKDAPEGTGAPLEKTGEMVLPGCAKSISGDDERVFILLHTGEILVLQADNLQQVKKYKLPFADPKHIAFSKATGDLWVGDKKGTLHVLKGDDFAEVATISQHKQGITTMTVSPDGKSIATGDQHRYTYVHDAESKEVTAHFAFQPASLLDVGFSDDGTHLLTVATDMSFGYINIATGKYKHVKMPHGDKKPMGGMFLPDGKVATYGEDCVIRIWQVSEE